MISDTTAPNVSPRLIENIMIVAPIECSLVTLGQCIIAKLEENPLLIITIIITIIIIIIITVEVVVVVVVVLVVP